MLKQDDGQKRHEKRKTARCAGFQVRPVFLVSLGLRGSPMLLLDFWWSSVVHLCVYVCAREGTEEGREFKNDVVAFANHSPGVH